MIGYSEKSRQVIEKIGGASRDRTDGLVVANDALSQLSYSPTYKMDYWFTNSFYQRSLVCTKISTSSIHGS
jgi:hypothetical protein